MRSGFKQKQTIFTVKLMQNYEHAAGCFVKPVQPTSGLQSLSKILFNIFPLSTIISALIIESVISKAVKSTFWEFDLLLLR
jgi:hypothetical protein